MSDSSLSINKLRTLPDRGAAEAFLRKAIRTHGLPEKITIDKSSSNTAALTHYNKTHKTAIGMRHSKYLNNVVEQDHCAVKRLTRPMLGFKSFGRPGGRSRAGK